MQVVQRRPLPRPAARWSSRPTAAALPVQPAPGDIAADDPARHDRRPQRRAARHQRLGRAGEAPRRPASSWASMPAAAPARRGAAPLSVRRPHLPPAGRPAHAGSTGRPSNTSYVERDSRIRLQGYDDFAGWSRCAQPDGTVTASCQHDYRELVPLLRHRYQPQHPDVQKILDRAAHVRMTIDARLQLRAADDLATVRQSEAGSAAAAVVLDPAPATSWPRVSYPLAAAARRREPPAATPSNPTADRPRPLRPLSAGLDLQDGHRDGRAAQGSAARAARPTVQAAPRRPRGQLRRGSGGRSATIPRTRRRTATVDLEKGIVGLLQRLLRAARHLRGRVRRRCSRRRSCSASRWRRRTRRSSSRSPAASLLRPGAGGGDAVPDGARGGDRRQRRRRCRRGAG